MQAADNVICSLFEGDYHLGIAVLINSTVRAGFRGIFWVGYKGGLPPWTQGLQRIEENAFLICDGVTLVFEKIDTPWHLTNYKPEFMLSIMRRNIALRRLCYFDPDIVSQASWQFYERWLNFGVALCEESVNGTMPSNHPLRLGWIEAMGKIGWKAPVRSLSRYYNGGFVGVTRENLGFLELWKVILNTAADDGLDLNIFMTGSREHPFYASDQDALNVAAMYFEGELSTVGPEGMGFEGGGFTMLHANSSTKPWRKRFVREALQGKPPLVVDRQFLACADGPLFPFPARWIQNAKWQCTVGLAISRFYRRPS